MNFTKVLEESKPKDMQKFKTIADIRKKTIAEAVDDRSIVNSINKLRQEALKAQSRIDEKSENNSVLNSQLGI